MDGIANVARQQQSQVTPQESQVRETEHVQERQQIQQPKQENVVKELQQEVASKATKINTTDDVKNIVDQLNTAMAPISTDLKFGVDSQDVFFVSVIDQKTDKIIRRFPAEKAQDLLPKMQEVSGILFDTKG